MTRALRALSLPLVGRVGEGHFSPLAQRLRESPPLAAAISPTRGETDGAPAPPYSETPRKSLSHTEASIDGMTEAAVSTAASLQFFFASM